MLKAVVLEVETERKRGPLGGLLAYVYFCLVGGLDDLSVGAVWVA
jgi:hypothetical protein